MIIGLNVHSRNESELNGWQFGMTFDRRGLSSCWSTDNIWSYSFPTRFRQWDFSNDTNRPR
jgi:hypothetical protein